MDTLIANAPLYIFAITVSFMISFALTPFVRLAALKYDWVDAPSSSIKTHKAVTPSLGGIAICIGFVGTLLLLRAQTQFPSGTLHSLRALVIGGTFVFLLGIIDDLRKPQGLGVYAKFSVQVLAALLLMAFGIRIRFIMPSYIAAGLTLIWVVGITNAMNIVDIMDGLSASQAAIAALGFLMISLPSEELYVNFAASALAGATLGFLPWNLSARHKIFMGDSGSMLLGFILASLSLGTRYSDVNNMGVYAPLLILMVPIFDTLFVMYLRIRKGQSPFLGSKDHFALRLEESGYSRPRIVVFAAIAAVVLGFCAFLVTQLSLRWAIFIYLLVGVVLLKLSAALARIPMR